MARTRRSSGDEGPERRTGGARPRAERPGSGGTAPVRSAEASLLQLQRSAGNAGVGRALRRGDHGSGTRARGHTAAVQRLSVQRHASFEHTLLGNTPPKVLGQAAVTRNDRAHLLHELWRQTMFFFNDAAKDPRSAFPDVRWIKLRGSGLWVSYGELNALADYLPDSEHIDGLTRSVVEPVLQRMRSGTSATLYKFNFRGQADAGGWELLDSVATEKALDKVTAGLGDQRYFGLLTRNACTSPRTRGTAGRGSTRRRATTPWPSTGARRRAAR
jgi:hypothetical protein